MERAYKTKTIEKIIRSNVNYWLYSIKDEELRKAAKSDYIVTGGAITNLLLGEMPNDYDIYFKTPEMAKRICDYYLNIIKESNKSDKISEIGSTINGERVEIYIKSQGIASDDATNENYEYFELTGGDVDKYLNDLIRSQKNPKRYTVAMMTTNAISLHGGIQIITRFTGQPEKIHENFDFVHTTNWYTEDQGLNLNLPAVTATISKTLQYVGSKYPLCSMFRLRKFIKRGWNITAGEMLKIGWDISKLNLSDIHVLREQITGVDSAYFYQLLEHLNNKEIKFGENGELDRTYLYNLINTIFDDLDEHDIEVSIRENDSQVVSIADVDEI